MAKATLQLCKETYGEDLFKLYEQIHPMNNETLLTCATFYVKDMIEYLALRGLKGDSFDIFFKSYQVILDEHRFFWDRFETELYVPLEEAGLPFNMTNLAAGGTFEVPYEKGKGWYQYPEGGSSSKGKKTFIPNNKICALWIKFVGWSFFKYFTEESGDLIRGYYEKKEGDESWSETCEDVLTLSKDLLSAPFNEEKLWYPFSVIFSILLIRTGFVTVLNGTP